MILLPLVVSGLLGVALLFGGYPLFRVLLVVTGALFGFLYGPELLTAFGLQPGPVLAWLTALITAILLALMSWQLFGFALFLWGFFSGYGIGLSLVDNVFIALGAGVVVALLALAAGRFGVIVLTSLVGAWLLVNLSLQLIGSEYPLPVGDITSAPWGYAVLALVALLGIFIQLRLWPERRY